MLRKKTVVLPLAIGFTMVLAMVVAAGAPSGADNPWDRIWAAIDDMQAQIDDTGVPAGTIVMWSGTLATIPDGWALCDGANGTPDLMDRFIMSVSDTENPGTSGGSVDHNHLGLSHSHGLGTHTHTVSGATVSTFTNGAHTHDTEGPSNTIDVVSTFGETDVASPGHTHSVKSAGDHSHFVSIPPTATGSASGDTASTTTSTQKSDHLPPYYKLAFIMKFAE